MNKNNTKKVSRKLLTATMATVLMISLSSCSGSNNSIKDEMANQIYASCGDATITKGELWEELKWSSKDVLETQITNVVLNNYIEKITKTVNTNSFNDLSDSDKDLLGLTDKEEKDFIKMKNTYETRLVDYVIQDIYSFNYNNSHYFSNLVNLGNEKAGFNELKYIDSIYSNYFVSPITKDDLASIREAIISNDKNENAQIEASKSLLDVAKKVSEKYYPLYAKELLAIDKITEEADEKDEKYANGEEDSQYFAESDYASKFKKLHTNNYDLNLVLIHFASTEEYNDTLRAFGLKFYNKKLYYIGSSDDTQSKSYDDYCKYYDDFSNSDLTRSDDVIDLENSDAATTLEIFVQIYNYVYGEYVTKNRLDSNFHNGVTKDTSIEDLRKITLDIVKTTSLKYEDTVNTLLSTSSEDVIFDSTYINGLTTSFATYLYETLSDDVTDPDKKAYTTSSQSATSGCYMAYKFGSDKDKDTTSEYAKWYNSDRSNSDIYDYIHQEGNESLALEIREELIIGKLSDSNISSYLTEASEDVNVKIYNEALEILYTTENNDYSKAVGSAPNNNVLATIEYDGKTYNLNVISDEEDENTINIPGTDTAFGAYDYLEKTNGSTTAIDLLTKKMIKQTKAYEETGTEEKIKEYKDYINYILYLFANGGYASNGYPASIGKYNFLMLYFHTASINEIVNNYYRVQYASAKLLTDYSNDELISFFKEYTDDAYDKYFSLSATRLVVYYDGDDDGEADDVDTWANKLVTFEGVANVPMSVVAKSLAYEVYNKISASSSAHADKLTSLVTEINDSAKAEYSHNLIAPENVWAKYKKLGLNVKTEDITATNSSTDIDWKIKNRLYKYATDESYQYYINSTAPSAYLETITKDDITQTNDKIIKSTDGFNLLLVTEGTAPASAKWTEEDNTDKILEDIIVKFNEQYYKIDNVYNEEDKLTANQIKLYVLDYMSNNSSTLSPADTSSALSTFLSPVLTRFTSSETQRIVLLSFMKAFLVNNEGKTEYNSKELYDIVTFDNQDYNGADGIFAKLIVINQNSADSYLSYYKDLDDSKTVDAYENWWTKLEDKIASFLIKEDN